MSPLLQADITRCRPAGTPGLQLHLVGGQDRGTYMEPENGSAVIAAAISVASVSTEPSPKRRRRPTADSMCSYANNARSRGRRSPVLAGFSEEVHASLRPA